MKIYVPSHNRANTIRSDTLRLFPNPDGLLVHDPMQADLYSHCQLPVFITGISPRGCGKAQSMVWAIDRADPGEWLVFLDDDIQSITALPSPYYEENHFEGDPKLFKHSHFPNRFREILLDTTLEAEQRGANLASISPTSNSFFRKTKFVSFTIPRGWITIIRKVRGRTYHVTPVEEWHWGLQHLSADGVVLVNRFAYAKNRLLNSNQRPAYGEMPERQRAFASHARLLKREYGDYVKIRQKKYGKYILDEIVLTGKRFPLPNND